MLVPLVQHVGEVSIPLRKNRNESKMSTEKAHTLSALLNLSLIVSLTTVALLLSCLEGQASTGFTDVSPE